MVLNSTDLSKLPKSVDQDRPTLIDVISAYRLFLGREPENLTHAEEHLSATTLGEMARRFINSPEFRQKLRPLLLDPVWVARELPNGWRIWLNLADSYISQELLSGGWEPNETEYMRSRLTAGNVVLDIGANVGWFSLVAAESIGPNGKVYAFEPNPDILPYLTRTVAESGFEGQVHVHNVALWDQAEELFLGVLTNDYNLGHAWLLKPGEEAFDGVSAAKTVCARLDDLLPDLKPDFIKIDIEGAEARALSGGLGMIGAAHPVILSELYPAQIERVSGVSSRNYISLLEDVGYDCWLLEGGRPTFRLSDFPSHVGAELVSVAFEPRSVVPCSK